MRMTRSSASKCRWVEKISSKRAVLSRVTLRPFFLRKSSNTRRSSAFAFTCIKISARPPHGNPQSRQRSEIERRGVFRDPPGETGETRQHAGPVEPRLSGQERHCRPRDEGGRERRAPCLLAGPPVEGWAVERHPRSEKVGLEDARDESDARPSGRAVRLDVPAADADGVGRGRRRDARAGRIPAGGRDEDEALFVEGAYEGRHLAPTAPALGIVPARAEG